MNCDLPGMYLNLRDEIKCPPNLKKLKITCLSEVEWLCVALPNFKINDSLQKLDLRWCHHLLEIDHLTNLQSLRIPNSSNTNALYHLTSLQTLRVDALNENQIAMPFVKKLVFDQCAIDFTDFSDWKELEYICTEDSFEKEDIDYLFTIAKKLKVVKCCDYDWHYMISTRLADGTIETKLVET
jgi:hypothetical protein